MTDAPPSGRAPADTDIFLRYADAFVPRRSEQIATACSLLRTLPLPDVLDLACGGGVLTAAIASEYPGVSVTAVDSSAEMTAAAHERLARSGDRVTLTKAAPTDRSWRHGPYGAVVTSLGAVVTSLAVHHLRDDEKLDLYRAVYEVLAPGGSFVQADMFLPPTTVSRPDGRSAQ